MKKSEIKKLLIIDAILTVLKRELKLKPLGISARLIEECRNGIAKLVKEETLKRGNYGR